MGVMLESEIQQDRSMALLLTDETKTDRLERIIRDLITELGLDITDPRVVMWQKTFPGRTRPFRCLSRKLRSNSCNQSVGISE